ncbi:MAG TPA: hypothetical protein VIG25_16185, partial [Pyrinomonadaceae bacterium]
MPDHWEFALDHARGKYVTYLCDDDALAPTAPAAAAAEFAARHPEFVLEQPAWPFNESELTENVTHWPSAWLRRL